MIEKIQTANEDVSEKMQELDKKLFEIQKEYEEKNKK